MNLAANAVIAWEAGAVQRILWIGEQVVVIALKHERALPEFYSRQEMEQALEQATLRFLEGDPDNISYQPEETLTPAARTRRDRAWEIIRPLVERGNADVFKPLERHALVSARAQQMKTGKGTIYGYLRRYWQHGQTPNALLPTFQACGARGKAKPDQRRKRGGSQQGRAAGIVVTEQIREKFRRGIHQFFETRRVNTLRAAYQRTLEQYFNQGYAWQAGVLVPVLPAAEELPTFRQFSYWYYKERDLTRTLVKREGQRRFNAQHRAVLGESTGMAFGPGGLYQIDATVGDIYLVSTLDPQRIIGRPVIYLVVDVFSRLLVGLSVSLEGPSWLGAMLALDNAAADKVAFCQQFEVSITDPEWPCHHLPEMLLADRGELEGYNADNLVNSLNITVANTAPYRADMKGIIEQCFRLTNDRLIATLPGAVQERMPGDGDYRRQARLNIHQFTHLLIQGTLYHNCHQRLTDYPLDKAMLADGVEPYPIDLWNWGLQHRSGHLRTLPSEVVRLSLLPQAEAAVTRQGIRFQGLYYTCERAAQEGWYVKAGQSGRWKVRVSYHPSTTNELYVWYDGGRQVEGCTLLENTRMALFRDVDWDTARAHFKQQHAQQQRAATRQRQARAVLNAHKDQVVRSATEQQTSTSGQPAQVRNILENRQAEREQARQAGAWHLVADDQPATEQDGGGYIPPAQYLDVLETGGQS